MYATMEEAMSQPNSGISPEEALQLLKEGNGRFSAGVCFYPPIGADRRAEVVAHGQHPYATIIGCSDSRVPLEVLFNSGIGDIFVIRVAGNVCATDEIGSAEYGVDHLGTPLCVVLGHSHCGAVTAVMTGAAVHGSIPQLVAPIVPVAEQVKQDNPGVAPEQLVGLAVVANIWQGVANLLTQSAEIRHAVSSGRAQVIGAVYDLESGVVDWLGPHPEQARLLG
jgi:carbonic anhydrase